MARRAARGAPFSGRHAGRRTRLPTAGHGADCAAGSQSGAIPALRSGTPPVVHGIRRSDHPAVRRDGRMAGAGSRRGRRGLGAADRANRRQGSAGHGAVEVGQASACREMRTALIATLALVGVAVHFANGSPAGANAYLFFAVLLLSFGIYSRGMRRQNYWLSLTGLLEAWFLFDYCAYGTAVSVLGRSKTPLPGSMDEAYSRTYLVGALAFLAFACGAHVGFARSRITRGTRSAVRALIAALRARRYAFRRERLQRAVFLFFTVAGVLSIVVLLLDPESRQQLFYEHVGLSPREGTGRYADLFFMLPTTAVGLWYLSKPRRRYSRVLTMAGLFLIAALHLGCGRRLMWASTMLLVLHLCKVRGIFTLRARYLVAALPLVLLVSLWMEATKNIGWYEAADAIDIRALTDGDKVFDMVDNSVGRFDTTAALILNRETLP